MAHHDAHAVLGSLRLRSVLLQPTLIRDSIPHCVWQLGQLSLRDASPGNRVVNCDMVGFSGRSPLQAAVQPVGS